MARVRTPPRAGFTLIELTVVVAIAGVVITLGSMAFTQYFHRASAQHAAQLFAQDLVAARSHAVRTQEPVVVRVYEGTLWYEVESQASAEEIARRSFGGNGDIDLSGVSFSMNGDTLVFSARGVADMTGANGTLGIAEFSSGAVTYRVSFNGMGASKIDRT